MENQEVGFAAKTEAAKNVIAQVGAITVDSRENHFTVGALLDVIRKIEKDLEAEYAALPVVQEAKRIQKLKTTLANELEAARVSAKRRMLDFEDRIEAERVAEEARAQAEAKRLADEAALSAALEAEASGDKAQAEAILAEPVVAATIVVPVEKLKAKGHTRRRVYRVKITDAHIVPDEYKTIDLAKIEATARAWKKEGNIIPGVICYSEVV